MSTEVKLSKAQISKIIQTGGVLGYNSNSFSKKCFSAPLGISAAASATDAGIQKKIRCSGRTTLITST